MTRNGEQLNINAIEKRSMPRIETEPIDFVY